MTSRSPSPFPSPARGEGTADVTVGLVLAAGASERMGRPKALLAFDDGTTLLERQVAMLLDAGCSRAGIVIGAAGEAIRAAHPALPAHWIVNERWELGPFSSLAAGISAMLDQDVTGLIVLPVDVAGVAPDVARALIVTARHNPHLDAVVPEHAGRGGHPVLLSRAFAQRLAGLDPAVADARLDAQIAASRAVMRLPVLDPQVVKNLNTPEEWEEFSRGASRG